MPALDRGLLHRVQDLQGCRRIALKPMILGDLAARFYAIARATPRSESSVAR
jgi:hypothetical protein